MTRSPRGGVRGGWLLVGLIVLITFVAIALGGLVYFLTEHRKRLSLEQNRTKAIYLAESGIMAALYGFRSGQGGVNYGFRLGTHSVANWDTDWPNPAGGASEDVFILSTGELADVLVVSFLDPEWRRQNNVCSGRRDRLQRWRIWNALLPPEGNGVVIDRMTVAWAPDNGESLLRIRLGDSTEWNSCGGVVSGVEVDLTPNVSVPAADQPQWSGNNDNMLWFSTNNVMPFKNTIDITFTMTDGSTRVAHYDLNNPADGSTANLTLRATGEVRAGAFPFDRVWRRLQVEYRMGAPGNQPHQDPGTIVGYRELQQATP